MTPNEKLGADPIVNLRDMLKAHQIRDMAVHVNTIPMLLQQVELADQQRRESVVHIARGETINVPGDTFEMSIKGVHDMAGSFLAGVRPLSVREVMMLAGTVVAMVHMQKSGGKHDA